MPPYAEHRRPVVDLHAHAVLESTLGRAGAAGPELGIDDAGRPWFRVGSYLLRGVRYRDSPFLDVGLRIAAMDRAGIDVQLLSPNPLTYFTDLPVADAVDFCRSTNDGLAELVAAHPGRLLAAAQLPMQDVPSAVRELERAVRSCGHVAAYIDTDPGRPLDDPALDDLYAALVELDVPLFVHPTSLGTGPPAGPPDDPRLRRWDLDLVVGFAASETLAAATLVIGGVLERHPRLDVCLSHGGGAIALLAGRFEAACRLRPWGPERLRDGGFETELRRLWFDTHVHSERALTCLVDAVGTERLVFGTNFAGWDSGSPGEQGALAPVLSDNAARLLRGRLPGGG